ncbi:F0F1 ATP synthase subunit gamma [Pseudomonas sp. KU26590]|uniref:F0F1 ATP synthase subunit gamma n=1 Tax=Pseudomonas sp. KU26590 TaxID=2991051 RepID=UPI00223D0081|nr:F0F1 ATP synthase subunit gamma [Pseudomonas sp. KU26590]UZJ57983.1 F0F1 ATP synthase subunit gamma [Pseudomonas sp. KU26590]
MSGLRRQIASAGDLRSVVRTMKASAAAAIGQYEKSVAALADYACTVELGLSVCLRAVAVNSHSTESTVNSGTPGVVNVVVFGSDQGLVGRFNEVLIEFALSELTSSTVKVWAVGERMHERLLDAGIQTQGLFAVPGSVAQITQLVGQILQDLYRSNGGVQGEPQRETLILFYNRPTVADYDPVRQQLLPLDQRWQRRLAREAWPTPQGPEMLGTGADVLGAFIREHLFVSLFRASAESSASENASRLAAMQRADRNIGALQQALNARFHRLRQAGIDEELFDVIAGFDALIPDSDASP